MQAQTSKMFVAVVITAIVAGGAVYLWQQQAAVQKSNPASIVTQTSKPVITSPAPGSKVAGPKITIKGTAIANGALWAYINSPSSERLGSNSYANGGAGTVGADGTFSLDLAEPCSHNLTVVVVAVPSAGNYPEFWSADSISEPVSFTTTGALPGICTQ